MSLTDDGIHQYPVFTSLRGYSHWWLDLKHVGREDRNEKLLDIGPDSHSIHRPSRTIGAVMQESLSAPVNVGVFQ